MRTFELRTGRLILRGWHEADREPFAEMNGDAAVTEFFPATLDRVASDALVDRFEHELAELGFCPFAVEIRETGAFLGFVGLHAVTDDMVFGPTVEVGWRLARRYWGHGFATEAGARALSFGFEELGLAEIVSFTSVLNARSRRVMERLGMIHDPRDDFEHPRVPEGHRLRPHVLYRAAPGQRIAW